MKVLVIPDIHQHIDGIEYAEKHLEDFDKIVFLGDYVDDWESSTLWNSDDKNPIAIIDRVCKLKKENDTKVILLFGNHDLAYIVTNYYNQNISGHQKIHHESIRKAFIDNIDNFNIAYEADGWIFSHAGISKIWIDYINDIENIDNVESIEDLNNLFKKGFWDIFDFVGGFDVLKAPSYSGDNNGDSILWIRPKSLLEDEWPIFKDIKKLKGQIVGHTEVKEPPLILDKDDKKLIIVDSPKHDCFYSLDTEKIPESTVI